MSNHSIGSLYKHDAPTYELITQLSGYNRIPKKLMNVFMRAAGGGLPENSQVLDFGSGTGLLTKALIERQSNIDVTGLEPCPEMAAQFEKRFKDNKRVKWQSGGYDQGALPLPSESQDAIISAGVFSHIRITPNVMSEFMRVLKPKGLLAFTYERHTRLLPYDHIVGVSKTDHSHKASYVEKCVESAGGKVIEHDSVFAYLNFPIGILVARKP